jgi:hypothetical protein
VLESAVRETVAAGGDAVLALERPREVALIGEAGECRDRGEGLVLGHQTAGTPFEPNPAGVLTDALRVPGSEDAGQVRGMEPDLSRDL